MNSLLVMQVALQAGIESPERIKRVQVVLKNCSASIASDEVSRTIVHLRSKATY